MKALQERLAGKTSEWRLQTKQQKQNNKQKHLEFLKFSHDFCDMPVERSEGKFTRWDVLEAVCCGLHGKRRFLSGLAKGRPRKMPA